MNQSDDLRVADAVEDYRQLLLSGRRPNRRAFLDRHADIAGRLAEYLDALEFVQSAAPELGPAPEPGPEELSSATPLGDFRLIREVGRGGMGIVYEAEQLSLGRRVALKVLSFAAALDPRRLQRFRNEAQAAAQLRHSNIVPVYAVGCERGVHYYAMDYVEGVTLAELIHARRRHAGLEPHQEADDLESTAEAGLPDVANARCSFTSSTAAPASVFLRAAARWIAQAAEALDHAHQNGVVHRDVKPANLMVDAAGTLWVMDFGLAQVQNDTRLTRTGDLLGTLRYMSPEQALGVAAAVGPHSDVYALGATLYELLTLQPAVVGQDRQEVLRHLASTEPIPPRHLSSEVPVELETIALKALAKAPEERYGTAGELAEDLRRFLDDRPIRAKPPTIVQRVRRWSRRHAVVATTAVSALLVLVLVVVIAAVVVAMHEHEAAQTAEAARRQITAALAEQQAARTAADEARKNEQAQRRQVEGMLERQQTAEALRLLGEDEPHGAMRAVVEGLQLVQGDLAREEMHRFRFAAAQRRCPQVVRAWFHDGVVRLAEFSPDGSRVLTASDDGTARAWNASTGQPATPPLSHDGRVVCAAFSPDSRWIVTGSEVGEMYVWDADTGRRVGTPLRHRVGKLNAVFSPDGKRVLSADMAGAVRIWHASTGRVDVRLPHPASPVHSIAFRPDGAQAATASGDGMARLWDAKTGKLLGLPLNHGSPVGFVAFSHDGRTLLTTSQGGARLWEVATGKPIARLEHLTNVNRAAFCGDGRLVVTASIDTTARVWEVATGRPVTLPLRHGAAVRDATFSRDGSRVFTAGGDGRVRCWDVKTGAPVGPPLRHAGGVWRVAVHPATGNVLTAGEDDTARLWTRVEPAPLTFTHERMVYHAAFSPDGQLAASASWDGTARIWDAVTGRPHTAAPLRHSGSVRRVVFSPDGRRVATASLDATARIWDTVTGEAVTPPLKHNDQVTELAFAPDGRRLATSGRDATVRLWDATTGQAVLPPLQASEGVYSLQWSADGTRLLSGSGSGGVVRVWGPATGEQLRLLGSGWGVLHPNSRHAATVSGNTARVWDVASGESVSQPMRHRDGIDCFRFSPDGRRVVTTSLDSTARVWDSSTGQPISPPLRHDSRVLYGEFSPDGRRAVTASTDHTVRIWDAATGELIAPPIQHADVVWHAAFAPDGRRIVTACGDGKLRVWSLPFEERPVVDLVRLTEVQTGMEWQGPGRWVPLDVLRFRAGWAAMRAKYPKEFPAVPPEEMNGWDWRLHQRRGRLHAVQAQGELAVAEFSRALERCPDNPALWRERGKVYAGLGKWEQAAADWGRALERNPDDPRYWADRAQAHAALAKWEEAVADYSRAIALAPNEPVYLALRAVAHRAQFRWDETAADFVRLTELTPDDPSVWRDLAFARAHQGQTEEARKACERALELVPWDPASWVERGRIHDAGGNWDDARKDYARAIQLGSDDAWVWFQHAIALAESGDGEIFGQHAARMLERFSEFTDLRAHFAVRTAVLLPGDGSNLERVQRLADAVLQQKANGAAFLAARALAHYRAGQFEQAVASARAALNGEHVTPYSNGRHAVSWLVLAMAHHRLGKREEARDWLSRAARWMETTTNRKSRHHAASCYWQGYAREEQLLRKEAESLLAGKSEDRTREPR